MPVVNPVDPIDGKSRGQLSLPTPSNTVLADEGTYYKISGTFAGTDLNNNFSVDEEGKVSYSDGTRIFHLTGVSDLKVDKACLLTYGLYKNGELVTGAETPHTFTAAAKTEGIAITTLLQLINGDYFQVYAKSSVANTTITVDTLLLTFAEG